MYISRIVVVFAFYLQFFKAITAKEKPAKIPNKLRKRSRPAFSLASASASTLTDMMHGYDPRVLPSLRKATLTGLNAVFLC